MFYVYILQSQKDSSYYNGYTSNPTIRLEKHNNAKTGYTARKQPWTLLYTEAFENKSEAIKRERLIKAPKSQACIEKLISERKN